MTAVSAQPRIPSNVPRPFPILGVWSGHETTPSLSLHPPPSLTQGSARCSNGEVWLESGGGSSLLRLPHSHACLLPSHPSHCSRGPHALLAQNIAPDFPFVAKLRGLINVAQTQSIIPIISSLSISISTLPMLLCTPNPVMSSYIIPCTPAQVYIHVRTHDCTCYYYTSISGCFCFQAPPLYKGVGPGKGGGAWKQGNMFCLLHNVCMFTVDSYYSFPIICTQSLSLHNINSQRSGKLDS